VFYSLSERLPVVAFLRYFVSCSSPRGETTLKRKNAKNISLFLFVSLCFVYIAASRKLLLVLRQKQCMLTRKELTLLLILLRCLATFSLMRHEEYTYSSSSIIAQHTDLTWILRRRCFVYIILFLSLLSTGARWRACKKTKYSEKFFRMTAPPGARTSSRSTQKSKLLL
jgi:NhaP-type Na+/H+ or K+/H+ antiporter